MVNKECAVGVCLLFIQLKGSYYAFHFLNFSQCVVCMFGHKKIYKITNLKVQREIF